MVRICSESAEPSVIRELLTSLAKISAGAAFAKIVKMGARRRRYLFGSDGWKFGDYCNDMALVQRPSRPCELVSALLCESFAARSIALGVAAEIVSQVSDVRRVKSLALAA